MGLWISGTKKFLYLNIKRPGSLADVAGLQVESAGKDAGEPLAKDGHTGPVASRSS